MPRHSKTYRSAIRKYRKGKESIVFALGQIPQEGVPEIKISYRKTNKDFLGHITSSKDVASFIRGLFDNLELQESFVVLYLNQAHKIIGYYKHTIGAINATIADVRLIMATALTSASVAMIISHNHPSGNTKASEPDIQLTKKINEASKLFEVKLLDHVIVTKASHFSFADEGML
jgi:DNA repair protein RadC